MLHSSRPMNLVSSGSYLPPSHFSLILWWSM